MKPIKSVLRVFGLASTDMPKIEEPQEMPDPDDKAIEQRNMRDIQARRKRGRVGTMFSGGSNLG
jgi:hypothetical protein